MEKCHSNRPGTVGGKWETRLGKTTGMERMPTKREKPVRKKRDHSTEPDFGAIKEARKREKKKINAKRKKDKVPNKKTTRKRTMEGQKRKNNNRKKNAVTVDGCSGASSEKDGARESAEIFLGGWGTRKEREKKKTRKLGRRPRVKKNERNERPGRGGKPSPRKKGRLGEGRTKKPLDCQRQQRKTVKNLSARGHCRRYQARWGRGTERKIERRARRGPLHPCPKHRERRKNEAETP